MQESGIIQSILDTDLYKFTMQQAVCKLYPNQVVKYEFYNRGQTKFPLDFAERLQGEVSKMANLALTKSEQEFLRSKSFFDPVYVDFLAGYRFDPDELSISQINEDLSITIHGYWYLTILWEVPLMALISELYFWGSLSQFFLVRQERKIILPKEQYFVRMSLN